MSMEELLLSILLVVLSLVHIREIIAITGIVPRDRRYSRLVYNMYDLEFLGFLVKNRRDIPQYLLEATSVNIDKSIANRPSSALVDLLSDSIHGFDHLIQYGQASPSQSLYYINTMEASHRPQSLATMVELLKVLIRTQKPHESAPDFLICPKEGNTLLVSALAQALNCACIFVKSERERSRVFSTSEQEVLTAISNFEGGLTLLKRSIDPNADTRESRPVFGYAVDCNASGGSQLRNTIEDFNSFISRYSARIQPIDSAFMLFRADDKDNIDRKFREIGVTLHRYIDLRENDKKKLFDLKTCVAIKKQKNIRMFVKKLDKEQRLNVEVKGFEIR